MLMVLLVIL